MNRAKMEKRFAVVVRFDMADGSKGPHSEDPPLVYWHRTAGAAARRLAALINGASVWVPAKVRGGQRFYVVDHESTDRAQYSLYQLRKAFNLPGPH